MLILDLEFKFLERIIVCNCSIGGGKLSNWWENMKKKENIVVGAPPGVSHFSSTKSPEISPTNHNDKMRIMADYLRFSELLL